MDNLFNIFYLNTFVISFLFVSPSRDLWNYFTKRVEYDERTTFKKCSYTCCSTYNLYWWISI